MTLAFKPRAADPLVASYRYRVLEPIAFLGARGHAAELYDEARFAAYEAVVFSKAYGADDQTLARRLREAGKRVLLDLCDDHFFNPEGLPRYQRARADLTAMIALCDAVVCSTPVLAETVRREAGLDALPAVAPDVYEQATVQVGPPTPPDQPAHLLWFGRHGSPNAAAGMSDILLIQGALAAAQAKRPFELVVCSDSRERFDELLSDFPTPVRFVAWTPASFAAELARTDGVVIPLSDNPFVAAKTHNRLTLALSAGVPVAADRLDAYAEFAPFCSLGDWEGGLEEMLLRPEAARARAAAARPYLQAHWSPVAVAPLWEAALGLDARPPESPARLTIEPGRPIPLAGAWLARERRNARSWLLAGEDASPALVAAAQAEGLMVMSLGAAAPLTQADIAYVVDAEILAAHPEALAGKARFLLVPEDLHSRGWAAGRSLSSWAADLPVLRKFQEEDRLVLFPLWTGGAGVTGDFSSADVPLRLLAEAGVRTVRSLGLTSREPATTGFEGLRSVLGRHLGGAPGLVENAGLSYAPYEPSPAPS